MTKRILNTNIGGRVKKVRTDNFLVPLFEAISNSIHAIEDRQGGSRSIQVELFRQPRQLETVRDGERAVTGFRITDDGLGFTDENMASFCEADSAFKSSIGGKGVGRFSWLKFFEKASVESVFAAGQKAWRRSFTFSTLGLDEDELVEVTSAPYTIVTLDPLYVGSEPKARKSLQQIMLAIIEHFIVYLVTDTLPDLTLRDGAASESITEFYRNSLGQHQFTKELLVNESVFRLTGIKFYLGQQPHAAFLCGDKRVAEKILLSRREPAFAARFIDDNLGQYAYLVCVQSKYLDGLVRDDRDGFLFPEAGSLQSSIGITKEQLTEEILQVAREHMTSELVSIRESNIKIVTAFVHQSAPQYRYLLNKYPDKMAAIHDSDPIKIDQALRRIQFEEEQWTRSEITALLRKSHEVGGTAKEEWRRKSAEIFARLNEEGKANLASYVVQRRLILDLLMKRLEATDGGRSREEAIHQLIFPMRKISDDVSYEEQNLWIIDERLSYHYYLASDKPLKTIPPAESTSARAEPSPHLAVPV